MVGFALTREGDVDREPGFRCLPDGPPDCPDGRVPGCFIGRVGQRHRDQQALPGELDRQPGGRGLADGRQLGQRGADGGQQVVRPDRQRPDAEGTLRGLRAPPTRAFN